MKRSAVVACLMAAVGAYGQDVTCNSGDIAWVSSAVNADVGLASGAGRCLSNTVAGAAYNDPTMPWGVQAAFDCSCAGLEIAILGNTGDYGSATASWNNRFDTNKDVRITINTGSPVPIVYGAPTVATSCRHDNSAAGCPVLMDFTGGLTDGFTISQSVSMSGLRVTGAPDDCIQVAGTAVGFAGMELDNCLNQALESSQNSGYISFVRNYVHDIGDNAADVAITKTGSGGSFTIAFNYFAGGTGVFVRTGGTNSSMNLYHNIMVNSSGDCVQVQSDGAIIVGNTLVNCGEDGIDWSGSGNARGTTAMFNLITGASGWGINRLGGGATTNPIRSVAKIAAYNVMGGNGLGDLNPSNAPQTNIMMGNVVGASVVYAGGADYTPMQGAELTLTYPRGGTTITINAGAVSEGGGALLFALPGLGSGSGVFIPGGPR
jgi:hypothetical protein